MRELVEDDLMGYDCGRKILSAGINDEDIDAVSLGDRYRVPKCYIHSGIGEVVCIERCGINGLYVWVIDLKSAAAEPVNPCTVEDMLEIST